MTAKNQALFSAKLFFRKGLPMLSFAVVVNEEDLQILSFCVGVSNIQLLFR
jgi:hypothetical protein